MLNQRRKPWWLLAIWLVAAVSFALGVSLPIAKVERFFIFDNTFSLLGAIRDLATQPSTQNITLLLLIILFTLIFPVAKLIAMLWQIRHHDTYHHGRLAHFIAIVGRFSMVDVFVIALMVVLLKLGVLVNVSVLAGFYCFTLSAVLGLLLAVMLTR